MPSAATVQSLLDEVSRLLAAPATLESPEFELIGFGAHDAAHGAPVELDPVRMRSILARGSTPETRAWFESWGIASTAAALIRTPAEPELGIGPRLCFPVRLGGGLLGYVWLLDDGSHRDGEPVVVSAAGLVERIAALLAPPDDLAAALVAAIAGSGGDAIAARLPARVAVGTVRRALVSAEIGGMAVHLVDAVPRGGPAGVGTVAQTLGEVAPSHAEAVLAWHVGQADPRFGPVVEWDSLGAYRMLADVRAGDPVLATLADSPDLIDTLEVYLDHAGNVAQAAAALHVHRQTLYYRLSRIEALTGLSLSDGRARLSLHMSVKLRRLGR